MGVLLAGETQCRPATGSIDLARGQFSGVHGQGLQLVDLANAYRLDDQLAQSLSWARWAVLDQVWGQEPIDQRAWHVLGHVLLDLGRYSEAAGMYQRADPDGTHGRLQHNRARALLGEGAWAEAWALAEQRGLRCSGCSSRDCGGWGPISTCEFETNAPSTLAAMALF